MISFIQATRVQGETGSWELLRFLCETKELDEGIIQKFEWQLIKSN